MGELDLKEQASRCMTDDMPPCANACPFDIDVPSLVGKIKKGNWKAAFRQYSNSVLLPYTVSHICPAPCQNSCVRNQIDAAILLKNLEKGCVQMAGEGQEESFFVPAKRHTVLVVGGGPAGLSCAVKLARRGYTVTLAERDARLGGGLWQIPEVTLPARKLATELERVIRLEFLSVSLNTPIARLEADEYSAILLAAGSRQNTMILRKSYGISAPPSHVFQCHTASESGDHPIYSLREGIRLSYSIEAFLKVGRTEQPIQKGGQSRYCPSPTALQLQHAARAETPESWTPDEMMAEAARCAQCHCTNCVAPCDMLGWYKKNPKKLILDLNDTIHKTPMSRKTALRPLMACSQCDSCKPVCPAGIDIGEICLEGRRELHRQGQLPMAIYDYWLEDMKFSNGPEASLILREKGTCPQYLFFPGCQLGASDHRYVRESYRYIQEYIDADAMLYLNCCGAPAFWAADETAQCNIQQRIRKVYEENGRPVFILTCPTCVKMFKAFLPELKTISLWALMARQPNLFQPPLQSARALFDPCQSKHHPELQRDVRQILRKGLVTFEELSYRGKQARCCGHGGLVDIANPALAEQTATMNTQFSETDYITYCVNCRDIFVHHGKPCNHLLDLLLGDAEDRKLRPPPSPTQRRENRRILKQELLQGGEREPLASQAGPALRFTVPPELQEKMDAGHMVKDDIEAAVLQSIQTGNCIQNAKDHSFICHLQVGLLTYWVQYVRAGDGSVTLQNVYKHKMQIQQ